ncbi:uncharacterized protein LOC123563244 [Mercenaria mercenaria]|uniref:uncharacterized protein LOC123563244 n=1 Tax=Mercenaria mercenaria TaxID=6596 RepID=UPI00234E3B86|nr:uncharacterized protein LOC123563244 [Mercenaria mercenaria]
MASLFGSGKKPKGKYQELGQGASDSDEFSLSDDEKVLFKKSGEMELNLFPETRIKHVKHGRSRCQYVVIGGSAFIVFISLVVVGIVSARSHGIKPFTKPQTSQQEPSAVEVTVKEGGGWKVTFDKMAGEGSVRLLDVDGDGFDDIIFASARALRHPFVHDDDTKKFDGLHQLCKSKGEPYPCMANVIALNGHDGSQLWSMKVRSEIFVMNCEDFDINKDGKKDCIGTGRSGQIAAFNPYKGETIWTCEDDEVFQADWNTYHAAALPDWDGDGVPEVLIANGGDTSKQPDEHDRAPGRLVVLSGATGKAVSKRYLEMPNSKETYMSPVMFTPLEGGATYILFGSGGETVAGDLMGISLKDFCLYILGDDAEICTQYSASEYTEVDKDENGIFVIYRGEEKGVMVPPVVVDYDSNGVKDILMTSFEGINNLYSGDDLHLIWTANFSGMETYGTPAPGYFNDDSYVDFMVTWNQGVWMTYESVNVYVISGVDGSILWTLQSGFMQMSSSLSIATSLAYHDAFLFKVQGRDSKFKMTKMGLVRLNNTGGRQKRHNDEPPVSRLPPVEWRKKKFYSGFNCGDDLSSYKGEVFVIDRNSVKNPVKILDIPAKKHTYDANPKCSDKPESGDLTSLIHDGNPGNQENELNSLSSEYDDDTDVHTDNNDDGDHSDGNHNDDEDQYDSKDHNDGDDDDLTNHDNVSENDDYNDLTGDNHNDDDNNSDDGDNEYTDHGDGPVDTDSADMNSGREGSPNHKDRMKREDTKRKMCTVEEPDNMSSGIIGDVDGDGNLDYISVTSTVTMLYDQEYCHQGMTAELVVQKVSLEKGLLDGTFQQVPVKAETSMKMSGINSPALREKTFLPMSQQRWSQYFGTKDKNVYG